MQTNTHRLAKAHDRTLAAKDRTIEAQARTIKYLQQALRNTQIPLVCMTVALIATRLWEIWTG